jgi:hypothetical protein
MSGLYAVTTLAICGAVVAGMALALLGRFKLALARRLDVGDPLVHLPLMGLYVAAIPLTIIGGFLVDRWGVRPVMILGSVALALSLLGLGAPLNRLRAAGAFLIATFGVGALAAGSIVLMPRAFFGVGEAAASLQVGTVFFAMGGLFAPTLCDILLDAIGPRRSLAVLAFLALFPAFAAALPTRDQLYLEGTSAPALLGILTDSDLMLAGLVLFFYAPLEAAVSIWTAAHLDQPENGRTAGGLLILFWIGFLAARLVVGVVEHAGWIGDGRAGSLLVLPALLAAVLLGNLSGAGPRGGVRTAMIFLGVALGPIFPTLLAMSFRLPGPDQAGGTGTSYGLLFAAGAAGSGILAPVLSRAVRAERVQLSWRVPIFLALALTVVALAFILVTGRAS